MAKRILLVEDDEFQRLAETNVLRQKGFDVCVATNGEEALRLVAGPEKPDLIVLDLIMPKLSGFEVLRRLKHDEATAGIPVIVLTNLSQESDRRQVFEFGALDYLVKANLTLEKLVQRIEAAVTNRTAT
jgi:CheY-like chemotaxis protein